MGQRVEAKSAHLLCRRVSQPERYPAVGILMNGNCEKQNRYFDDPLGNIKGHKRILSVILTLMGLHINKRGIRQERKFKVPKVESA